MKILNSYDISTILFEIGLILGFSRLLGEIARRYRQPMVVGEIFAGVILGPTVLGVISPNIEKLVFPMRNNTLVAMEGLTTVAVVLLLLVAGIEINLTSVWRQRKSAFLVSMMGIITPFGLGFGMSYLFPYFFGHTPGTDAITFSLFFGTALAISALPVIAKTLLDMNLLKSDLGTLVMASAAFNDLIGWVFFSIVISLMTGHLESSRSPYHTIVFITFFTLFMLTIGRWAFHRILPWLERKTVWPGGILGFVFAFAMIGAAATEWFGVHAVLGSLLVGIAVGDTKHLTERTKDVISQFAMNIFAPLFFAFIGLRINFAANFNLPLIGAVFSLACLGKIIGCSLGAVWSGNSMKESLAVGFGMNARGAMEIILGLLALEYGLIDESLFVALVIMAVGTTMLSGPMMGWLIREKKPLKVEALLNDDLFEPSLKHSTPHDAIFELTRIAAQETGLETEMIFEAVWEREQVIGTALGGGIAVPHARMLEITSPIVVLGRSEDGIDFNAMDGAPVQLVFLLLTPNNDHGAQLQILADIARIFTNKNARTEAFKAQDYESFIDAIRLAPDKR